MVKYLYRGQMVTVKQLMALKHMTQVGIRNRLVNGIDLEKAVQKHDPADTWYVVYRRDTDEVVANGTRADIMKQMGWTLSTFKSYKSKSKKGLTPYIFEEVPEI